MSYEDVKAGLDREKKEEGEMETVQVQANPNGQRRGGDLVVMIWTARRRERIRARGEEGEEEQNRNRA